MAMIISNFGGITSLTAQASELESEQSAEQSEAAEEVSAEAPENNASEVSEAKPSEVSGADEGTTESLEEDSEPVEDGDLSVSEDAGESASEEDKNDQQEKPVINEFKYRESYSYVVGEAPETIALESEITAVVNGEPVSVSVEWNSDSAYNPEVEGTYTYTGTILGNYDLGEGVSAPKVVVKILSKENAEKEKIKSFSYESVYEYIIGKDAPDSIELPEKIKAVVGEKEKEVSVKWSSDKEYKKDEAGEYTFTAELPKEYSLADGVEAPKVVVTLKEAAKTYEVIVSGTKTVITVEGNFPEGSELIAAKVENKLSYDMLNASNKLNNFLSTSAYDIKVVKDGAKVDLPEGSVAKVTIRTDSEFSEDTKLVHVKTDLIDDQGNLKEDVSGSVVNDIKSGAVQTEVVEDVQINGDTVTFELKSFSTIIAAAPGEATGISKLEINYNGVKYDLTQPNATVPDFGYRDEMTLHVEAQFGAGTEKEISITIPEGLSFRKTINTAEGYDPVQYVVNGTDETLASKVITTSTGKTITFEPNDKVLINSDDVDKKLGIEQHNGTITLKFHGHGENNDTKSVEFDIPIYGSWRNDYRKEYWESGTAWFYDRIPNASVTSAPVRVIQSMKKLSDEIVKNEYQLDKLTFKNNDGKSCGKSWNSKFRPEISLNGQMSGNESFWVRPGINSVAYKMYSVTFLAPKDAVFKGFAQATPIYSPGKEVVELEGSVINGKTVPAGYKAYTFSIEAPSVLSSKDLSLTPIWSFPEDKFPKGSSFDIKIFDVRAQYYGREYAAGQFENFAEASYPSLTYNIVDGYEEVFTQVKYENEHRETDGYISDYTLYMGAPGFEHTQEREAGYFMFGNRGSEDSKPKTVTITYDVGNSKAIGVVEQRIPASADGDHKVSNIQYKVWNSADGSESGWLPYNGDSTVNLSDLGIAGNSGIYIKAIKFDIDTVPAQSILSDAASRGRSSYKDDSYIYKFNAVVLSEQPIAIGSKRIEHTITIENTNGDLTPPNPNVNGSAYRTVSGKSFNGLYGESVIYGNNLDNDPGNIFKLGDENNIVYTKVHFHKWQTRNAQLIDAIYLISPYGEEYRDITVNYGDKYTFRKDPQTGKDVWTGIRVERKRYSTYTAEETVQPELITIPNGNIPQALRNKYPNAVVYKLDFTGINEARAKYTTRQIGGSVLSVESLENTPLSTMEYYKDYGRYNGAWISFKYSNSSAPEGRYDDLMWVEYNADTAVPVKYMDNPGGRTRLFADTYNLTGKGKMIGPMGYIQLEKSEGLDVSSSIKQESESTYRTYRSSDSSSVVGVFNGTDNYRLTVENNSATDVKGFSVYFPVPKMGENWGNLINPEGDFKFSMNLSASNAGKSIPNGFKIYYAKNASPTSEYAVWDNFSWTEQSGTASWTDDDWKQVNFVKMISVNPDGIKKADGIIERVFDINVDPDFKTEAYADAKNVWAPYFLRKYTASESWVSGLPVAAQLKIGSIKGFIWEDENIDNVLNGKYDEGETLLTNYPVELYDISSGARIHKSTQMTDGFGRYEFKGLDATNLGAYELVVKRNTADYISFTAEGDDMKFVPSADHMEASLAVKAKSGNDIPEHGTGLVAESVTATAPVVRKIVQGGPANASTFGFMWEADFDNSELPDDMADNEMPMPDGTAANTQETRVYISTANQGESRFGNITFNREGTYSYIIRELNTGQANYRYDEAVYRVVYEVIEVETQNGVREMYVEMSILKNEEVIDDNAGLTFTNVYTAPGGGGGGGGGGTPTKPTPKPTPAAPVTPAGEVLGARRTDPEQQVLGARRGTNKGSVLGARRGKTGEASNASRLIIIAGLSAMIAILAKSSKRKKED